MVADYNVACYDAVKKEEMEFHDRGNKPIEKGKNIDIQMGYLFRFFVKIFRNGEAYIL